MSINIYYWVTVDLCLRLYNIYHCHDVPYIFPGQQLELGIFQAFFFFAPDARSYVLIGTGILAVNGTAEGCLMVEAVEARDAACGGFLKWGYPKIDGFIRESPSKMDDLGVPLFQESP